MRYTVTWRTDLKKNWRASGLLPVIAVRFQLRLIKSISY
jgi:hypothetical protein